MSYNLDLELHVCNFFLMSKSEVQPKIALLYHANLNHFSLSPKARQDYASHHLAELVRCIQVPAAISIPAEDLLYLYLHYNETFQDILSNPNIVFLASTFAHIVAGHDFGHYVDQVKVGADVFQKIIPEGLKMNIAYPSEVELPPEEMHKHIPSFWSGLILGGTRVIRSAEHDHFLWEMPGLGQTIPALISRRQSKYRAAIHDYLREEAPVESVLSALQEDDTHWSNGMGHPARIDLETPILNEVKHGNEKSSGPRIDLWKNMHTFFFQHYADFVGIKEIFKKMNESILPKVSLAHDSQEDEKWMHVKHKQAILKAKDSIIFGSPAWYLWLSTHHSDYFCTELHDWVFQTKDGGTITIGKKQIHREPELLAKLALLQGKRLETDDRILGEYIEQIQSVHQFLSRSER